MSRESWSDDKLLFRLVHNKTNKSRWQNISVLRKRPSLELFDKSVELLRSDDAKLRKIGIDILAQLGSTPRPFLKETIRLYFELLAVESTPDVLMSLLYAIGHNNERLDKDQINRLCAFVRNDNDWVKEGLVFALLGIDDEAAIEVLVKLSADRLSHIRNWATFGLGSQLERDSKSIREALWNRIDDKHQETKLEAVVGLAIRKDKRVNEVIRRELLNGEYGTLLFEAVIETGDKSLLPVLEDNWRTARLDKSIDPEWVEDLRICINKLASMGGK